MFTRTLLLLASLLISPVFATSPDNSTHWLQSAHRQALAKHPIWLKLLHYESGTSAIQSAAFFTAPDGLNNPETELKATIEAFFQPATEAPDTHAQCRFPARFLWLQRMLGKQHAPQPMPCPDYANWTQGHSVESLSIVYATGYLGNPASYYGHTFLKFNSRKGSSEFLDNTINYGAVVPDDEDPVSYILKGIFGGYIGGFSEIGYYFHNNNYGENELRDLWEYQLNLPPQSVELVVAHAWEVLKQEYTYFFFRKNCAYRMAELVEIADGVEVIHPHLVTMPQALIKAFSESSVDGHPLVKKVSYHPSRQTKFYNRYLQLQAEEKQLVHAIAADGDVLSTPEYIGRSPISRQRIVDALLDYLQFARSAEDRNNDVTTPLYRRVLAERFQLPVGKETKFNYQGSPPHEGRDPSLLQLAPIHNSHLGSGLRLTLRPAYYDVIDGDNSHVRDSSLIMGQLDILHLQHGGTNIRRLSLVEIESVNAAVTGLPQDNGLGWRLEAGLESHDLSCDSCLIARGLAQYGYSKRVGTRLLLGGYLGGQVQENYRNNGHVLATSSIFGNLQSGQNLTSRLELAANHALDGRQEGSIRVRLLSRYRLGQNLDLRLSYDKDVAEELSLSFGFYF